jgi:molybdenum cofactor synthesis domain-containing protein
MAKTAAVIIIGNEILSGKVTDENGAFLARELRRLGVDLQRMVVVADDADAIGEEVRRCSERFDVVLTTGGVGPTHDDVTMAGIARGLGRAVVRHPELAALIGRLFGAAVNEAALKISEVPDGAELIVEEGLTFPLVAVGNVYIFPGVPQTAQHKFAAVKHRFQDSPYFIKKIQISSNEEQIAADLNAVLKAYPNLLLGSYPTAFGPDAKVVLTLESKDPVYLAAAFDRLIGLLPRDRILKVE